MPTNKLLIPEALPKEMVAGIDTITVKVGDQDVPARFGGVLKDCAATVIELEEGKLPQTVAFPADGKLARIEPFWAVSARELAGMDVRTEFSRWVDKQQGYADQWYPVVERPSRRAVGCWTAGQPRRLSTPGPARVATGWSRTCSAWIATAIARTALPTACSRGR